MALSLIYLPKYCFVFKIIDEIDFYVAGSTYAPEFCWIDLGLYNQWGKSVPAS